MASPSFATRKPLILTLVLPTTGLHAQNGHELQRAIKHRWDLEREAEAVVRQAFGTQRWGQAQSKRPGSTRAQVASLCSPPSMRT